MTSHDPATATSRLRELLRDTPSDPAAGARALADERRQLTEPALQAELLGHEQRWLEGFHQTRSARLREDLVGVRRDWLEVRVRQLCAAPPRVRVLLDLAEAQAMATAAGEAALRQRCDAAIASGVGAIAADDAIGDEVGERFALLTSSVEEVPIEQQIELLRCTGALLERLAAQTGSRRCSRFGRRLLTAADDRELARRMERRLGARGVAALETTNFVLLVVVLVTLIVEASVDLTPAQRTAFHWVDALACLFFVADFAFELLLHPSRWSWFRRNALTDLVPAIPSVLFLLPAAPLSGGGDNLLLLRILRVLRVTWAARYVQALRPLLRSARLLLFLLRGLDGLASRFSKLLNREFVFVPAAADVKRTAQEEGRRELAFDALRREHELVELLPQAQRRELLHERVAASRAALSELPAEAFMVTTSHAAVRDVAIGDAIEFMWTLRTQDLRRFLEPSDVQALDRVVRILSAVPVRWLPLIRRLAVHPLPESAEARIVALGRRVADWLESWHGRMLFFADLHGIVTGPQILDRVATAMVKASQRPAVRLLLFGGLFLLFDRLLRGTAVGDLLSTIVGLPLVLLGSFCLVFLFLGHWMKRLAGQASDNYRLTSEAHFISQLERVQSRYEAVDLDFLTARVFHDRANRAFARRVLEGQLASARTGVPVGQGEAPDHVCLDSNRVALLYLHFLDGAPLHISDVKTTEQLLANQSLENLRSQFLPKDRSTSKRLRKLKLDDGSLFRGPYLWFRFITESIAVEAAKRIAGYNSFCIPIEQRPFADPVALERMSAWLARRRDPRGGRSSKDRKEDARVAAYPTTEFTALDFLGGDEERDRHLAAVFGDEVLETVRFDRRTMIREIFGTRPVHHLPKQDRSFNPLRFYETKLSHGRVLLAPAFLVWRFFRSIGWVVSKVRQIVREVLDPDLAMQRREVGEAPFAVALRKIHRMKAPGLLEAVRLRLRVDPVYAGAPAGWSVAEPDVETPEVARDVEFLHLREREASQLRDEAARVRREVAELHALAGGLPSLGEGADAARQRAGELAVTCAWITDKDEVRTLMFAARWRDEVLPALGELAEHRSALGMILRGVWGLFGRHPVDQWCAQHGRELDGTARRALRIAYAKDHRRTRRVIDAWRRIPAGVAPRDAAIAAMQDVYRHGPAVRRDVLALRAVQSLAVLDIRNYRDLVFRIGAFEADGESPELGYALP
ncbi:MAG: hypothetical protein VXY92_12965 [Planctomycetota bacterium]|nr:hypothetical protein [Planctomycetota bacterium]